MADPAFEPSASLVFSRFRMVPHRRELLADGEPVKLGGRAFDVLMALIEARGAVVSKDALMARVWPGRIVEENALQSQISALRAAFGPERELIRTVSGRGYQFTGEIRAPSAHPEERTAASVASAGANSALPPTNLPTPVGELIGRDDDLREVLTLAAAHRLVTLTGAGGIGKTQLALAAARQLLPQFSGGVWLAELAPLADPGLVPVAVATAAKLQLPIGGVSPEHVGHALGGKPLLLVLDNCEHVIEAAAAMAEALLHANPAARVIATSREPLKAEGEWVYPVPPLAVPAENAADHDDPLRYAAVQLFLSRARAAAPHFAADQRVATTIQAICRRLDGIPLAIELAAARAATLGIEELAAHLDDRCHTLAGGRRTALPRHQTLQATLDWSYELLPGPERVILRRLAVIAGFFSLDAAAALVADPEIEPSAVVEGLANLVAKSLVVSEADAAIVRYRLLETTRAYALEKLAESGERERLARRHAEYYRDLFEQAETEWKARPTDEWLADYGPQINNVRAALDWAFSPAGDASVAVALTASAIPLWMHLSLLEECHGRVERALGALAAGALQDRRREMKLYAADATSLILTRAGPSEVAAAWTKTLEIAESLDDAEYQLRSLWGLWSVHLNSARYRLALEAAERFRGLAAKRSDGDDRLIGERMIGDCDFLHGDLTSARRRLESMLSRYTAASRSSDIIRFQVCHWVSARALLARILWVQGLADEAMRTAERSIEEARETRHAIPLCYALALAGCPIALWAGDLVAAERCTSALIECSKRHRLTLWQAWGRYYQGVLEVNRGDFAGGLRLLRAGLDQLGEARFAARFVTYLGDVAEALGRAGQIAEGLRPVEEAIARFEHSEASWLIAPLLRSKGELLLLRGGEGAAAAAADHFRQALDRAHRQDALSTALRAATSLARLLYELDRPAEAIALLQPVYNRFTEGFEMAHLKAAKAILDAGRRACAGGTA
jgi:predicted ATPase/DNA-binding winged helix-turn-helix (wHTH) protein